MGNLAAQYKIYDEKPILWIGSGMSLAYGYPSWSKLAHLVLDALTPEERSELSNSDPIEVFSYFEEKFGRNALVTLVSAQLKPANRDKSNFILRTKGFFDDKYIVTTNYDTLIENSLSDYQIVKRDSDIPLQRSSATKILKIHGCISDPETLVLNERNYQEKFLGIGSISTKVDEILQHRNVVFVGYSVSDQNIIQKLFKAKSDTTGFQRSHVAILLNKGDVEIKRLQRHGILVDNLVVSDRSAYEVAIIEHIRSSSALR